MIKSFPYTAKDLLFTLLNSYSQIFFSTSKVLAILLVIISFFDYGAGIGGIVAVVVANLLAYSLGYNSYYLKSGLYGFNSLLVGLGVGLQYQPSAQLYIFVVISAITSFFLTIVFQGVLGRYGLPFLSIPFLVTIWIVGLAGTELTALDISERGIYTYNELFGLGGTLIVSMYNWLESLVDSSFVRIYFYSLGAIFFQKGLLAGMIISIGLLIYSRITFVLSILGFSVSYLFYLLVGIEANELIYRIIGFNYILTAIALGGYYLIPGRTSFGWIILLLPTVVLLTVSTQKFFTVFKVSPYSLAFNIVVLGFLYALKLREKSPHSLLETPVQLGNPEKNLYLQSGNMKRFPARYPVAASLPFFGEWVISQGHDGEITHMGAWRHAWDFVVLDKNSKQYKGSGDFAEDYFCYGKTVIAPYDGTVMEVVDSIQDNIIGDVNTRNNWGNTVLIKHTDGIYSKLSHLKYHSSEVKAGDVVKRGQPLAKCGNSGRSPYPHLHFQFQSTPYIGSPTLCYPFGHYLLKSNSYAFQTFSFPLKGQVVANPSVNRLLFKALHFIPGQHLAGECQFESTKERTLNRTTKFRWEVKTDVYNTTFLECQEDGSVAYLYNSEHLHYFTNFSGKKNTALYWFFLAFFKVPLGIVPNSKISDQVPVTLMFDGVLKVVQDLIAPVFLFLKANYHLSIEQEGDILSSEDIKMTSVITTKIAGMEAEKFNFTMLVKEGEVFKIDLVTSDFKIQILCRYE